MKLTSKKTLSLVVVSILIIGIVAEARIGRRRGRRQVRKSAQRITLSEAELAKINQCFADCEEQKKSERVCQTKCDPQQLTE